MNKDNGATPLGSGLSQVEPVPVSPADAASIPSAGFKCKWCTHDGWYTSYSGGVAHDAPCDHCNSEGVPRDIHKKAQAIVGKLPASVCRALTTQGAAIPDSLWFGQWAGLREHVPGSGVLWRWSMLGLAVRGLLRASAMSARSDETQGGSVRQDASATAEGGDAQPGDQP